MCSPCDVRGSREPLARGRHCRSDSRFWCLPASTGAIARVLRSGKILLARALQITVLHQGKQNFTILSFSCASCQRAMRPCNSIDVKGLQGSDASSTILTAALEADTATALVAAFTAASPASAAVIVVAAAAAAAAATQRAAAEAPAPAAPEVPSEAAFPISVPAFKAALATAFEGA